VDLRGDAVVVTGVERTKKLHTVGLPERQHDGFHVVLDEDVLESEEPTESL